MRRYGLTMQWRGTLVRRADTWLPTIAVLAVGQGEVWSGGGVVQGPPALIALSLAVAASALLWRKGRPIGTLLAISAALLTPALIWGASQLMGAVYTLVVAIFACGRYGDRPIAYAAMPIASALILAQIALDPLADVLGSFLWTLNSVWIFGLGAWLRQKQDLVERGAAAAGERARAIAAEERVRIARELHDILAHSLSVMVVQAQVADELLGTDIPGARRAIGNVEQTGRAALGDTRRLLSALRDADPQVWTVAPVPGLGDVSQLVDRLRTSGLPITLDAVPVDGMVPARQGQVAFRVVQEALTNALRHAGPVPIRVSVRETADGLELAVHNGPRSEEYRQCDNGSIGQGLIGMRERVESLGGRLQAGPTADGGFSVTAALPLARSS